MKKHLVVLIVVLFVAAFVVPSVFAQGVTPPVESGFDFAYISELLQALILATVPVLAGMAMRWLVTQGSLAKEKLSAEQTYALEIFIRTAVYAAEQMKVSSFISDKLDYATENVQLWLDARGIAMDASEIRARIEAAVMTEFNSGGLLPEDD